MIDAIFRPIKDWPGERTAPEDRERSPFQSTYDATLHLLERELRHLDAENVVIQAFLDPSQIRTDGWPKSINLIHDPGVIVSFTQPWSGDQFVYPCDRFPCFQDNLRAIALALEALRKVDRYGITRRGEQYQGFKALPPPVVDLTPERAAEILAEGTGVPATEILRASDLFEMALKLAMKRSHPDKPGGDHDRFAEVNRAGQVLSAHHQKAQAAGA